MAKRPRIPKRRPLGYTAARLLWTILYDVNEMRIIRDRHASDAVAMWRLIYRDYVAPTLEEQSRSRRRILRLYITELGAKALADALSKHPEWETDFENKLKERTEKEHAHTYS